MYKTSGPAANTMMIPEKHQRKNRPLEGRQVGANARAFSDRGCVRRDDAKWTGTLARNVLQRIDSFVGRYAGATTEDRYNAAMKAEAAGAGGRAREAPLSHGV